MNRKIGMHHSIPSFQISNRSPAISHRPTIRKVTFKNTNAQAPRNFAENSSDRDMGLLNSRVIDPGSNICGMTVEVTRIAAIMPTTPTIQPIAFVRTHCLTNVSTCFFVNGKGPATGIHAYVTLIDCGERHAKAPWKWCFDRATDSGERTLQPRGNRAAAPRSSLASLGSETPFQSSSRYRSRLRAACSAPCGAHPLPEKTPPSSRPRAAHRHCAAHCHDGVRPSPACSSCFRPAATRSACPGEGDSAAAALRRSSASCRGSAISPQANSPSQVQLVANRVQSPTRTTPINPVNTHSTRDASASRNESLIMAK